MAELSLCTLYQGWARDIEAQDQDETKTLHYRDRDETLVLPRPKQDVITSRDETEVHVVLIAVVQLDLFFTFITSRRVNVIINFVYSTHIH